MIHAEGELQASRKLVEAANVMSSNSGAMQLRYLQTLADMSSNNTSTIVFPLPLDMMKSFLKPGGGTGASAPDESESP